MDSEELIGKMDALLNRHRQSAAAQSAAVPDIPVLVNVVEVPRKPEPPEPKPAEAVREPEPTPPEVAAIAPSGLSDNDAEFLARSIFRHVMINLEARLAQELGAQLTDRLESIIADTVATALADFRQELANAVSDAIAEAILDYTEIHSGAAAQTSKPDSL
jgi:hypothetical protein